MMVEYNQNKRINVKLTHEKLNLSDLKTYLRLKFKSYQEAGARAGISECRVRQIVLGYKVPKNPRLIHQLSEGWGINIVKLTQLFDSLR